MELNYGMSLEQKQQLSQNQIQSLEVLAMDSVELSEFLQDEYLENPLLDYSEEHAMPGGRENSRRCWNRITTILRRKKTGEEKIFQCRRQKASKTIFWSSCRMEHAAGNWQSL